MNFSSFFDEFRHLTNSELRNIYIRGNANPVIPDGNYGYLEFYCPELDCDCRKVIINIVAAKPVKTRAVIHYGWESEAFYRGWFPNIDPDELTTMQGPSLDLNNRFKTKE